MRKTFYASQSIYSEPGPYREALMLGGDAPELIARWIGSFMQHPRGAESKERGFTTKQVIDLELRSVTEILAVAAERNLLEGDPTQIKVGGLCRDFAILAASAFRAKGIPARLRVGFADYIVPDFWEDHWLCEWHDGQHWKRLDVEFAAAGGASFNTLDVPRERFQPQTRHGFRLKTNRASPRDLACRASTLGGSGSSREACFEKSRPA